MMKEWCEIKIVELRWRGMGTKCMEKDILPQWDANTAYKTASLKTHVYFAYSRWSNKYINRCSNDSSPRHDSGI